MTLTKIIEIAALYSEQDSGSLVSFYPSNLALFALAIEQAARATPAGQEPVAKVGPGIGMMANCIRWTDMKAMDRLPIGTVLYAAPQPTADHIGEDGALFAACMVRHIDPNGSPREVLDRIINWEVDAQSVPASNENDQIEHNGMPIMQIWFECNRDVFTFYDRITALQTDAQGVRDAVIEECLRALDESDSREAAGIAICRLRSISQSDAQCVRNAWISVDDFAALFTFNNQVSDSDADGYTASKETMKRLAELGVVQSFGFGRYGVTAFGSWLIESEFDQSPSLPLRTVSEHIERETAGHKLYMKESAPYSTAWNELPDGERESWRKKALPAPPQKPVSEVT